MSLSLGQSTVGLYGQTHQVLFQCLLSPAQRHQGLSLSNMTLLACRRHITLYTSNIHMKARELSVYYYAEEINLSLCPTFDQRGMSLQAISASLRASS